MISSGVAALRFDSSPSAPLFTRSRSAEPPDAAGRRRTPPDAAGRRRQQAEAAQVMVHLIDTRPPVE
jgi:hypothetical protein